MKNMLMVLAVILVFVCAGGMNTYAMPGESQMGSETSEGVSTLSGKVVETMDSGGYTYVSIEHDGKSTWVALPMTQVEVGQEVSVLPGFEMKNFKSKTLDRTFESIIFSSGIEGDTKEETAAMSGGMPSDSTHSGLIPAKMTEQIKVEKASGPNAYTVAELYAKSGELHTKSVVLKGQVVKVTQAVMDKNWVHIQDGSGSASDGTNNIIVTTQDTPSVGDIVTASGTLYKDKDFGMGYFYETIIEEATIK